MRMLLTALLCVMGIAATAAAQALPAQGGIDKAQPVAGDTGLKWSTVFDTPQFQVLRDYAEPGATRRMHAHARTTCHVFVLVTGQLRLTIDGEAPVDVTQGQVLTLKGAANHTFINTGSV